MHLKKWTIVTVYAGSLGIISALAAGAGGVPSSACSEWIERISSADATQANGAQVQALKERKEAADALVATISQPVDAQSDPRIIAAMKIAGAYRVSETVDGLLDKVDFKEGLPTTRPYGAYGSLAAETLVQIGIPGADGALARLSKETSNDRIVCLAYVIKHVLGRDCATARIGEARERARKSGLTTAPYDAAAKAVSLPGF